MHLLADIGIFSRQDIVAFISVAETIHKDLIHHRPFSPVRRGKTGNDAEGILLVQVPGHSQFIIIAGQLPCLYFKKIMQRFISQHNFCLIIIKPVFCAGHLHSPSERTADQIHCIGIISFCSKTDGDGITGAGAAWKLIIFRLVTVKSAFIQQRSHFMNIIQPAFQFTVMF